MEVITAITLEDKLLYYKDSTTSHDAKEILDQMIECYGLHHIIFNVGTLAENNQLAERSVRRILTDTFGKNHSNIVDDIMITYFRLLFFPMILNGVQNVENATNIDPEHYVKKREIFKNSCCDYLGSLPYKLVANLIPLPVLFNHCQGGEGFMTLARKLFEAQDNNVFLRDFAKDIGYNKSNIEKLVDQYLTKMSIIYRKGQVLDAATEEVLLFKNA